MCSKLVSVACATIQYIESFAHAILVNFAHIGFLRHNWVPNFQTHVSSSQHLIMVDGTPNTRYLDRSACHASHDSVNHYMVLNPPRRRYLDLGAMCRWVRS